MKYFLMINLLIFLINIILTYFNYKFSKLTEKVNNKNWEILKKEREERKLEIEKLDNLITLLKTVKIFKIIKKEKIIKKLLIELKIFKKIIYKIRI